jgi:hypothetical protein
MLHEVSNFVEAIKVLRTLLIGLRPKNTSLKSEDFEERVVIYLVKIHKKPKLMINNL